ncbi:MAG: acetyl-CoA hydrolase/transferase C-terminal domain-containing protein [Acidimicrobiia bacterium]
MDAVIALESARRVHVEEACGQPARLGGLLASEVGSRRRQGRTDLTIVAGVVVAEPPWARAARAGGATIEALMAGRGLDAAGDAAVAVPIGYADIARGFADGRLEVDTVCISTTQTGSLGIQHGYVPDAVSAARDHGGRVLVERNASLPEIAGAPLVDLDGAVVVDVDTDPVEAVVRPPSAAERTAAAHAARLVPDRGCVQVGIGTIGDAFCGELARASARGVVLHSGMLGDGVIELADSPVLGTEHPSGLPPLLASSLIGSRALFAWARTEPRVRLAHTGAIHPVAVTAAIPRFCAVNFALEVDLAGNVGAEAAGGRTLSGPGGQLDFATGACAAPGGRSIVVLASSTTATPTRPARSRIVAKLSGPTTTPASRVHYVVTEHGVAELAGRTLDQRAAALVAIADPAFRCDLRSTLAGP